MRDRLLRIYWQLQRRIAPRLRHSQALYEQALHEQVGPNKIWLDLGAGHQVLPPWRDQEERLLIGRCPTAVGLDCDLDSLRRHQSILCRVGGDLCAMPFRAESFDLLTANMVLEHLDRPEDSFREMHRVLKQGGRFLLHTPNAFGYSTVFARLLPHALRKPIAYLLELRKHQDVYRAYYRANSERTIKRLAARHGFIVESVRLIVTTPVFAVVPPVAFIELLLIRVLMLRTFRGLRTNMIAILRKAGDPASDQA